MIRVTRPGGRIVIYDFEWDSFYVTAKRVAIARRLHRFMADTVPNGHIGPDLWNLYRAMGLTELELVPSLLRFPFDFYHHALNGMVTAAAAAGAVTAHEATEFWADLRASAYSGQFHSGMQGFVLGATKPRA